MSGFDEIELLFERLLSDLAAVFSERELSEVSRFIDHGEYGLALDTVVDIFVEEKKTATPKVVAVVSDLATAMKIDPKSYQGRLGMGPK